MKNIWKYVFFLILCLMTEMWWKNSLKINGVIPNLCLCLFIYVCGRDRKANIGLLGILAGFGEYSLLGTFAPILSYIILIFTEKKILKNISPTPVFYIINIFFSSFLYEICFWFFGFFRNINFLENMHSASIQIFYNLLLGIIMYFILEYFCVFREDTDFQ